MRETLTEADSAPSIHVGLEGEDSRRSLDCLEDTGINRVGPSRETDGNRSIAVD